MLRLIPRTAQTPDWERPSDISEMMHRLLRLRGVSSAEDVIEMMLAGATAVEIGAANLVNPWACRDIIAELPAVMDKYRINSLSEIIGGAH